MAQSTTRSEYCQQQAEECATRATTTPLPEIKDAYLQLELGWRQLIADFEPVPSISNASATSAEDQQSGASAENEKPQNIQHKAT